MTIVTSDSGLSQDAATLRFKIDELDIAIARLVKERAEVSRSIQRERIRSGGARVDLARENEILGGYAGNLGPAGKELGLAVLTYCRGEVDASSNEPQG
jgi:chorismate mutase